MECENADFDDRLAAAGQAVAALPRPKAPSDLVARTLNALAVQAPIQLRRTIWLLRPITSPLARIAAAAAIVLALVPLSDLDTAEALGSKLEAKVVGPAVVNHVEDILDGVLHRVSREDYSQSEIDQLFYVPTGAHINGRARHVKSARIHSHV